MKKTLLIIPIFLLLILPVFYYQFKVGSFNKLLSSRIIEKTVNKFGSQGSQSVLNKVPFEQGPCQRLQVGEMLVQLCDYRRSGHEGYAKNQNFGISFSDKVTDKNLQFYADKNLIDMNKYYVFRTIEEVPRYTRSMEPDYKPYNHLQEIYWTIFKEMPEDPVGVFEIYLKLESSEKWTKINVFCDGVSNWITCHMNTSGETGEVPPSYISAPIISLFY